jgi:HSP20 family protein
MIRYPSQRRLPLASALDWLEEFWSGGEGSQAQMMPMDVRETDSGYAVEVGLPGVKPDDVDITLDGRLLTIRGRSRQQLEKDEGRYLLRERRSVAFSRSVTLPAEIDAEGVTTTFEDGELCVMLPISKRAGSRRIPVGSGAGGARQVTPGSEGSQQSTRSGNGNGSASAQGGREGQAEPAKSGAGAGAQ